MFNPTETNFIGRDPMQWWIGQVTDPEKGEWGNSLEKQEAEDGEDIYSHRCRVRIVGYHGSAADLPDKDLPLAHILLPANTANFLNPPPQGDSSNTLSLPVYCLTFGGVYGLNSVCLNALNLSAVNLSSTKDCLNKVPNIIGC